MRLTILILALIPTLVAAQNPNVSRKGSMKVPFVWSQQVKHSLGLAAPFYKVNDGSEPVYGLAWNPSLSLTRSFSDFSISIGSQLVAGYHPESSVDDSAFFYADTPLLLEANFGNNASKDFYSDFGWFLGGGYSYRLFKDNWAAGPVATIGVRGFVFVCLYVYVYLHCIVLYCTCSCSCVARCIGRLYVSV
ncbi:MAG: hypothetical protein ACKOYC_00065 [Bacteroidota bacterium]